MRTLFSLSNMTYFWDVMNHLNSFGYFMLPNKICHLPVGRQIACRTWPEKCGITPNCCKWKYLWWEKRAKLPGSSFSYLSEAALSVHYLHWGQWAGSLCTRWFRDLGYRWRHTAWWPFGCAPPLWAEGPCQCWGSLVGAGRLWKRSVKKSKKEMSIGIFEAHLIKNLIFPFPYKNKIKSLGAYECRIKAFLAQITLDKCSSGAGDYSQPCTKASS